MYSTFTTGTTAAVNGVCGTANGGTFSAPPTANLCSTGTASGQTNVGWRYKLELRRPVRRHSSLLLGYRHSSQACYAQPTGLVSWWKGDDDATDHMGHNNGTLENGAGFALGAVNDAFSFNGSNQYVLIGEPVPTDLQIQNNITPVGLGVRHQLSRPSDTYGTIVGSEMASHTRHWYLHRRAKSIWLVCLREALIWTLAMEVPGIRPIPPPRYLSISGSW